MKNIEIDDELYLHIVSKTQSIGESASSILRRLLKLDDASHRPVSVENSKKAAVETELSPEPLVENDIVINDHVAIAKTTNSSETVFNFINKEELAMQRGAVGRFLLILAALYRAHAHCFDTVINIIPRAAKGKNSRLYFAASEQALTASGSSTKPKQIPNSPFWVMTNSNTTRKKLLLTQVATSLGYTSEDVEKIRELL